MKSEKLPDINILDENSISVYSFRITDKIMEQFKDFVFHKKNINPLYNQQNAIEKAFELLFQNEGPFEERPNWVKQQEEKKKKKMKKKKSKKV